jgi:hypothetical protein
MESLILYVSVVILTDLLTFNTMGYYIDLAKISLEEYIIKLKTGYLPPSRKLLLDDIESQFQLIENQGIENIEELRTALKTKKKLEEFSAMTGISMEYLTILIREINSSISKPNRIKDFPEISSDVVEKLESAGIKHTLHLYERITTTLDRDKLEDEIGIDKETILQLTKLTDLSRVRWVNHTFAFLLFEAGYSTVNELADADAVELHKAIADLNNERNFFKGNIGLNDIRICIHAANEIPQDIQY